MLKLMCAIAGLQSPSFGDYREFSVNDIKMSILTFSLTMSDFIIRIC